MNHEIEKINFYFDEVKKKWVADNEFVSGFAFYSAWELVQKPLPFLIDGKSIELSGQSFSLVEENMTAAFQWDNENNCAALLAEGVEWGEKILIVFEDGEPQLLKNDPVYLEQMGLSYGERLEIIYDVIAYLKRENSAIDILNIKKKDYLDALAALSVNYPHASVSVMKRLSMSSVMRFMKKASEDMTADELSSQLHLPLNGSYAVNSANHSVDDSAPSSFTIPARTEWSILRDLQIQQNALLFSMEEEQSFILPFADAEIVSVSGEKEITFRVPPDTACPLQEGDILQAFYRSNDEPVGTFRIDIFDSDALYGRMRFFDPLSAERSFAKLYALPMRSPLRFLTESISLLLDGIEKKDAPPLLRKMTGLQETPFSGSRTVDLPDGMDFSQRRAWGCAVNMDNPVTLVQGPPGTGKTKVLVDVAEYLCKKGCRILIAAPSNTAVDNICRKLKGVPLLRFGNKKYSIASDILSECWIGSEKAVMRFADARKELGGGIYAGTHVGLLKDRIVYDDMIKNGKYDVVIFDEAGMASITEVLLFAKFAEKTVLFGDHRQLPPFPLSDSVKDRLKTECGPFLSGTEILIKGSALEWLAEYRNFPVMLLQRSYRCQNPRLLRFSSILFYDALVSPSSDAEYFKLPFDERHRKYPPSTLKLLSTSQLPDNLRSESLVFEGSKPGIENLLEALLCVAEVYRLMKKYPVREITVIAPYKRQVRLIRKLLSRESAEKTAENRISVKVWDFFLQNRISTVDSFQGGESDAVIICYVRSNFAGNVGFVDDPNRINVAHTRCRREMIVVGDIDFLKTASDGDLFSRLERNVNRDGEVIELTETDLLILEEGTGLNFSGFSRKNYNFAGAAEKSVPAEKATEQKASSDVLQASSAEVAPLKAEPETFEKSDSFTPGNTEPDKSLSGKTSGLKTDLTCSAEPVDGLHQPSLFDL